MKTRSWILFSVMLLACATTAQPQNVAAPEAVVVERGPHHAVRHWTTENVWPDGRNIVENHYVTELASGLNYLKDNQWMPSEEVIEIFQDGAVARKGQHQVIFAANLHSEGAIDLLMPDGQRLRSHIIGLAFLDSATGQSTLIAEPKDSFGEVIGNQVIYRDAFDGPFKADVRFSFTLSGFEQDILIRESLPSPADYQMAPASTRLEVWTEFLNPPIPVVRTQVLRAEADPQVRQLKAIPDLIDQTLSFGSMEIGSGRAFPLEGGANDQPSVQVAKSWVQADLRHFLIESVELAQIAPLLQGLPRAAAPARQQNARLKVPANGGRQMARLFPPAPSRKESKPLQMASALPTGRAVVLDYQTLNSSQTNYTFKADQTYYISGTVNLYGTNNIVEGGTVIKFAQGAGATIGVKGTLIGDTSVYRPAVLTASADSTVGEGLGGSLSGYYATTALNFDYVTSGTAASLQNIRILYALTAVAFNGGSSHELRHLQVVNAGTAVKADNAQYAIRNVLGWNLTNALTGSSSTGVWEHATLDGVTNLVTSVTGCFTNCLLTAVVSTNGLTGQANTVLASAGGVFKTVGSGYHYLTNGSAYRDIGTTNINPALADELKKRTTYPPIVLGNITTDTTLNPQAGRDTSLPDLGFHYSPLDYLACGVVVSSNVTLSVVNGAAVGLDFTSSSWGFDLRNARFLSTGLAQQFNYVGRAHMAQEKSGGNPGTRAMFYDGGSSASSRDCQLRMRFTESSQFVNDGYYLYVGTKCGALEWTHSRVYTPSLVIDATGSGTLVCGVTNTLFERGGVMFGVSGTAGAGVTTHLRNTLWRNIYVYFVGGNTGWTVRDNLFDHMVLISDQGNAIQNWTNAYYSTTWGLSGGVGNTNLASLTYETGPLGRYYQPTNSILINAGSRTADLAGLYHFTTSTNQVKETNSVVDIGLHYVATEGTTVWVEDSVPAGANIYGEPEDSFQFTWVTSAPAPYSGAQAHQSTNHAGLHQHYFIYATDTLKVWAGDRLFCYVYLDPTSPPSTIMLQWYASDSPAVWHRVYWGADNITLWGARSYMGPLPATGTWVRLEVPVETLGLAGYTIQGMAYTCFDGLATWDYAGKVSGFVVPLDADYDGIPDYLEDRDGNGAIDSGETDWNDHGDLGLRVFISRPRNGSNVP